MRRNVKLVMFDLDGTLVDSLPDLTQSANYVRRTFGLPPLTVSAIRGFIGDGAWLLIERSLTGLPPDVLAEGFQLFKRHYTQHCTDFTSVYPGCREVLAALGHKRVAVVTNKPDGMSHQILNAYGLADHVGLVVGSDTATRKKPDPEHVLQAVAWACCRPDEALLVGDSRNDVEAAAAAGIACCGVLFGIGKPVGRAGERPDFTIWSMRELLDHIE